VEPVTIPLAVVEEVREVSIRILHRPDQRLVSVLELLSPANKTTGDAVYLARRAALITQPVNLVELDLLIGGRRLPMGRPLPAAHFYAMISRAGQRPNSQVYAWTLRDPLPAIPIPLASPDPDIIISLQKVFSTAFDRGKYERAIDYTREAELDVSPRDRQWMLDVSAGK